MQITDAKSSVALPTKQGKDIPAGQVFYAGFQKQLFYKTPYGPIINLRNGDGYSDIASFVNYDPRDAELILR